MEKSITTEDYLKIIDELTKYKGCATLTEIANRLRTKRQSAYDEIKILEGRGLVIRQSRGRYVLSEMGQVEANLFLRKHRLAEVLLWKGLGMPWEVLDDQAMGIEHGITEEMAERICSTYGCDRCPHGNPIPDREGRCQEPADIKLSSVPSGSVLRLTRVIYETSEILSFLTENNMYPGSIIGVKRKGVITVPVTKREIEIPEKVSMALRFERLF
ncbi:metal-dependent transcriptional regulator [Thermogymnomonas acidicola]|nr:metal-dependent transcriptional regulator [Thermogymnomonas acidicola]